MRPVTTVAIGLALLATVLHAQGIDISRHGSRPPITGAPETFTGRVSVQPLFAATEHTRGDRRPGHVLARGTHRLAHPPCRSDPDCHGRDWMGAGVERHEARDSAR